MYARVSLLNGFSQSLYYKIPESWSNHLVKPGSIIKVPLQKREEFGLVESLHHTAPNELADAIEKIRPALEMVHLPNTQDYQQFLEHLARHYIIKPQALYRRLYRFFATAPTHKVLADTTEHAHAKNTYVLTPEQQAITDAITEDIRAQRFQATLLHGVTGSGKTEIYKRLIETVYKQGKAAVLLVPEVSLAVQFTHLLKAYYTDIPIIGFHSASSAHEKKQLWQFMAEQTPCLIIGVHLPIMLPLANLGIIIVDEEHDSNFQEKRHPHINSKEAALMRAHTSAIPIVLGSATPSLTSWHHAKSGTWRYCSLNQRFHGTVPTLTIAPLLKDTKRRPSFWITPELQAALADRLSRNEQSIIFLNRRGYSFFVQCTDCGYIFNCSQCSVSYTLHSDHYLRCHYCGITQSEPATCTQCKKKKLRKKGLGTQQVVKILSDLFPKARIGRVDLDTTVNKKRSQETIDQFSARELDILVGTQTITKGYHFPNVTLVGLIWADINLALPFYTAAEQTLQHILQVAGRAGRNEKESTVIVQTMREHQLFNYLDELSYPAFANYECTYRKALRYPPYCRLARLIIAHEDEDTAKQESNAIAKELQRHQAGASILGPARPPVHRIKHVSYFIIYIKADTYACIQKLCAPILQKSWQSHVTFTPNPLQ